MKQRFLNALVDAAGTLTGIGIMIFAFFMLASIFEPEINIRLNLTNLGVKNE